LVSAAGAFILSKKIEDPMKRLSLPAVLFSLILVGCAGSDVDMDMDVDAADHDSALLEAALEDIRMGWEQGSGDPFYLHFLDWEGARYFEGGGQNEGLQDLVEHHVEPEAELGLSLGFSNIQTHFEGNFAWALVDTDVQLTAGEREIHNRGHGTYLFRWVDGAWKVVHTQSASSPVRVAETESH
jgi:SnoaL-like protein